MKIDFSPKSAKKHRGSIVKNGQKKFRQLCPKPKIARPWRASLGGPLRNFFFKIPRLNIFQPKLLRDCGPRAPGEAFSFFRLRSLDNFSKIGRDFPRKKLAKRSFLSVAGSTFSSIFRLFLRLPHCSSGLGDEPPAS